MHNLLAAWQTSGKWLIDGLEGLSQGGIITLFLLVRLALLTFVLRFGFRAMWALADRMTPPAIPIPFMSDMPPAASAKRKRKKATLTR